MRLPVLALVTLLLLAVALPAVGQDTPQHLDPDFLRRIDQALVHGTVTPPGAPIDEKQAELDAYEQLVWGYPDLTADELTTTYFKDGRFGEIEAARTYSPRNDVTIVRDATWRVPHIFGETDEGMAFGAGYASAEDRLPIMELLRALGRAEAFELLEHNEAWLADAEMVRLYGYTEEEFQAQIDRLPEVYGQVGQDVVDYLTHLVAGINTFITQMQEGHVDAPAGLADIIPPNDVAPWRPTDVVAVVAIIRALFGAGGGGEMGNAALFAALVDTYGVDDARVIYEDFRQRYNLDGPLHTADPFAYHQPPVELPGTDGNVIGFGSGASGIESDLTDLFSNFPGGASQAATQLAELDEASRIKWENLKLETGAGTIDLSHAGDGSMSNWLAIGADRSATGHPILLGGPQAAYFDPQILVENVLHSPTIHAAGASFPGMGLVVIGRSHQAAWTATAGGSDMIDTFVEVLCDPDGDEPTESEVHYLYDTDRDGATECIPMDRRLHRESATLPGGEVLPAIYAERTVHGPVTARGKVGDTPVAVSRKRSTYFKELDAAVSIIRMNRGEAATASEFVDIFTESHNLSTNWAYVNDREIGYVHGGLYPRRSQDVHPDLPVWGTGEWDWQKDADGNDIYLSGDEHPHDVNPEAGFMTSWNNRTAPEWGATDNNWGYSAIYRDLLLHDQIEAAADAGDLIDPVELTQMMEHAGLTDLRGSHNVPLLLEVLDAGSAPSERAAEMRDLLETWMTEGGPDGFSWGALRRDDDQDGNYEHGAAIAIMDEWWTPLIHAMYDPALGQDVANVSRQGFHNAPGPMGSAFQGGFYGQVWTDLAMVLGREVRSPTSQVFCGSSDVGVDGSLAACAQALWTSLEEAGAALAESQGSEDPSDWTTSASSEEIIFLPNLALTMHWVNRPTTQVLAMFGAEPTAAPGTDNGPAEPMPSTGGGVAVAGAAILAAALMLRRRVSARPAAGPRAR